MHQRNVVVEAIAYNHIPVNYKYTTSSSGNPRFVLCYVDIILSQVQVQEGRARKGKTKKSARPTRKTVIMHSYMRGGSSFSAEIFSQDTETFMYQ